MYMNYPPGGNARNELRKIILLRKTKEHFISFLETTHSDAPVI